MSDSSRVQLGFVKEVTWGVTPAAALQALRYTKESLTRKVEHIRSDEVRADRQVSDIIRVASNTQGSIDFEFSAGTYDKFLEAALGNVFGALQTITASTISVNAGTSTITGVGLPVFLPGQWIRTSGFTNPGNNDFFQVVSSNSTTLVVQLGGGTMVTESTGASVTIQSTTVANGVTQMSFTLEKFFSDLNLYYPFPGMRLDTLELDIQSKKQLLGTMAFYGLGSVIGGATVGTGPYSAQTTSSVMNCANNVGRVLENSASLPAGAAIKAAKITFANNLRSQDAVANINPIGVAYGRFTTTGELTVYFKDQAMFNRYLNGVDSSAVFIVSLGTAAYAISLPAIRFTNGDVVGVGNDNDVMAVLEFEAKLHPTQLVMVRIDQFT